MKKIIAAGIAGVIVGISGQYYLNLGAYSLIPWGVVGLIFGIWCEKRDSTYAGALYGFCLSFAFMVAGYKGSASLISRLPFFALLGLFGAACGGILGTIGNFLRRTYGAAKDV